MPDYSKILLGLVAVDLAAFDKANHKEKLAKEAKKEEQYLRDNQHETRTQLQQFFSRQAKHSVHHHETCHHPVKYHRNQ